ncbi:MAG: RNA polymerase sigma factor [Chloroflexota bacterium]
MADAEWKEVALVGDLEQDPRSELIALMQTHETALYRYLVIFTADREVALDCLQDAFTRAYVQLQRGKSVNTRWLYTVARNRAIDELRRRKREGIAPSAIEDLQSAPSSVDMAGFKQAFHALPADDRTILFLAGIDGLSGDEMAVRLGIRHGTVRMRLLRARKRLRKLYEGGTP